MIGDKQIGEVELRKSAKCSACGQGICRSGVPLFWRLTIERFGIDSAAARRQDGLAMMLAVHSALAQIMGQDEPMAMAIMDPVTITLCETCIVNPQIIAGLAESAAGSPPLPHRTGGSA